MDDLLDTAAVPAVPSRHDTPAAPFGAEPVLWRYLQLLWHRKLLVLAGSVLPAAAVALLLFLWPARYTAMLVYERPLSEREFNVFVRRFYSRENLEKITRRLEEQGLARYARNLGRAQTEEAFARLVQFEVSPMYPRRLQTTDPATSEQIGAFRARLLFVRIRGDSEKEVSSVAEVVTGNVENTLPVYDIRNALKESIQQFQTRAAEIEDNRFTLTLELEKEKAKLEKLTSLGGGPADGADDGLVLQFADVAKSREFLPLSYQRRAVQSRIIDLEETLASDADKYQYYLEVLSLNDVLLGKLEAGLLTDCTVPQFLSFLGEQLLACQNHAVADYVKSYIRKTENLAQVHTRAGERPMVYPVAKHVVRRGGLALVLLLLITMFVAVLLEYRCERRWSGLARP